MKKKFADFKESVKKFWKENGKIIKASILSAAAGATAAVIYDHVSKASTVITDQELDEEGREIKQAFEEAAEVHKKLDEVIFTEVAPKIEDALLDEVCDDTSINYLFDVNFPGQEFKSMTRRLEINVKDVTE